MTINFIPGSETRVNAYVSDGQEASEIVALPDGGYIVTWDSVGQDGSYHGVFARRFDAGGHPVGSDMQINTYADLDQGGLVVAVLADGGYIFAWHSYGPDGGGGPDFSIRTQRFNAQGVAVGTETQVSTYAPKDQVFPSIIALADGGYLVAWTSDGQDGDGLGVYCRRYDASGTAAGGETRVNITTGGQQYGVDAVAMSDGGYVITWHSDSQGDGYNIYSRRFDAAGQAMSGEVRVDTQLGYSQYDANVAGLIDGGYVVSWEVYGGQDGSSLGVFAQRFDASGARVGTEFQVNTYVPDDQFNPQVTGLSDGGYVIIWVSQGQDGSETGIYGQRFGVDGEKVGSEFLVTTTTTARQYEPAIATLADGSLVISWTSSQDYVTLDIYQKVFAINYAPELTGNQYVLADGTEDTAYLVSAAALLEGYTDFENNALSVTDLQIDHGTVHDNGNGTWSLSPSANYFGIAVVTYTISDGLGGLTPVTRELVLRQVADTVYSAVTTTLASGLENLTLTGSGNINGTGNGLDNVLTGNGGYNQLDGAGGADTMAGGAGNDTYIVNSAYDVVRELTGGGVDLVVANLSYRLAETDVEQIRLVGTGDFNAIGNSLDNVLTGNAANNKLDGRGGADISYGGKGNDTYYVDQTTDQAVELTGQGTDLVYAPVTFNLAGTAVENLTMTGGASIDATGNGLANILTGNDGHNRLDGGAGADILVGGFGDDTYYVDNAGDDVREFSGRGTDTLYSSVSYSVAARDIENIALTGVADLSVTGNGLANIIIGNDGNNRLDGGDGTDTLIGGTGSDTYVVWETADVVTELANQGIDTVQAIRSFALPDHVENLALIGTGSTAGVGNGLDNIITGNTGSNRLTGGLGADTFVFLAGSGADRIWDFHASEGDRIDISAYSHGVVGGGGVSIIDNGPNTLIDLGDGNVITVYRTHADDAAFLSHIVW